MGRLMKVTVTILEQGKATTVVSKPHRGGRLAAPPPPATPAPSRHVPAKESVLVWGYKKITEVTRRRSFCNLCNREGYLSSLFSGQKTPCPYCLGSKFTDTEENLKTRLAGIITYLRGVRLLEAPVLIGACIGYLAGSLTTNLVYVVLALLGLY